MAQSCECPPGAGSATCELRSSSGRALCPTNGQPGKRIDTLTLKALLSLPLTSIVSYDYRFCRDPDCPTVYYSADGSQLFTEEQLRELVFQKHPDRDDVFVCYCFRHDVGSIRADAALGGPSRVVDAVNTGIQAGKCACEIRNPQGSCCLGNVRALFSRLQAAPA